MSEKSEPRVYLREKVAVLTFPYVAHVVLYEEENPFDTRDAEIHIPLEDYRALARSMPGEVVDFVKWIVSLDDPDPESEGFQDRRTTTLTDIIRRARKALDLPEEC